MKNSDSRYWLIPLLAAFAIYLPLSSISPSPEQEQPAQQLPASVQLVPLPPPPPPPRGRVSGEAAKLLCDYFGSKRNLNQGQKQARPTGPPDFDPKNLKGDYCRVKSIPELDRGGKPKYKVEYLIAIVPDPKDTRLDYQFDRCLDAIQRAIGKANYTFDRYWLPWDRSRTTAPVALATDPRTPQMEMARRHLYEPGVILFRDRKVHNRLLLLFLVGETPTGGIHKVAFKNALYQIEELDRWKGSKEEKELRVMGPHFSGSDTSLAILLKAWITEYEHKYVTPLKVRIVSRGVIAADKDLLETIATRKVSVSFHSTLVKRQIAIDLFNEYLKDRDSWINRGDGPQIALLSESDTASGQRARDQEQKQNKYSRKPYARYFRG